VIAAGRRPCLNRRPWAAIVLTCAAGIGACSAPPYAEHAAERPPLDTWSVERRLPDDRVVLTGRIDANVFALDPVIVTTAPADPAGHDRVLGGPYQVRGFDDAGVELFSRRFDDAALVAVSSGGGRHFMFVVDVPGGAARLGRITLTAADGRDFVRAARISSAELAAVLERGEGLAVERLAEGAVRVQWDAARFVVLRLHHARTGVALGVGRDGDIAVETEAGTLDLVLSDGVRSGATRVSAR